MKRSIVATILAATVLVSMVGMASAYNIIYPTPATQSINVNDTGVYNITVMTDDMSEHTIEFDTGNAYLHATLTGNGVNISTFNKTGSGTWTPSNEGTYIFTYTVKPLSGITQGEKYDMSVKNAGNASITAVTVPSVNPTPELATIAFVGIGLIGLVALGRRRT